MRTLIMAYLTVPNKKVNLSKHYTIKLSNLNKFK